MKKRNPVKQYDDEAGYPSTVDYRLCRRGFIKLTLGAATAVGAGLLLGPEGPSIPGAAARTKRKIHRVDFQVYPRHQRNVYRRDGADEVLRYARTAATRPCGYRIALRPLRDRSAAGGNPVKRDLRR